jgi:hypothetical protein
MVTGWTFERANCKLNAKVLTSVPVVFIYISRVKCIDNTLKVVTTLTEYIVEFSVMQIDKKYRASQLGQNYKKRRLRQYYGSYELN